MISENRLDGASAESTGAPPLEISNAMARVHKQFVGRGPTNSRTTIDGELVVCQIEGGYTVAEQTLDVYRGDARSMRRFTDYMSANDLEQNLQVVVFVLTTDKPDAPR